MKKFIRTKKGSMPFQIDFASARVEEFKKKKKQKEFERSVKGALYFLPNSTKLISLDELNFINEMCKAEAKNILVISDIAEPKKVKEKSKSVVEPVDTGDTNTTDKKGNKKGNK